MTKISTTKLLIGTLDEIKERIGKTVRVGEKEIAVFKLSNGQIKAIENHCPHKGGVLSEGIVCGDAVFCPMHDWRICLNSGMVQEPDTGCVKTYQIEMEGEEIYLVL